jgi:hypothetical protein
MATLKSEDIGIKEEGEGEKRSGRRRWRLFAFKKDMERKEGGAGVVRDGREWVIWQQTVRVPLAERRAEEFGMGRYLQTYIH